MAKSGKVVQLFQKPENFIKSRARELQLGSCYINFDWEESGIASALVSRKHTNGNVTMGFYLIDLKCLGIKEAFFKFNVAEGEMFDLVDQMNGVEIEYEKIHNIIYGAEAFANDCGFKPHKDFTIAQFILAEDNDDIPLIDIEFGEGGVPAFYVGPYDTPAKVNQILTTLDKNVGTGNYLFYDLEDEFEEDDEIIGDLNNPNLEEIYDTFASAYIDKFEYSDVATLNEDHIDEILEHQVNTGLYNPDNDLDEAVIGCAKEHESLFEEKSLESLSQIHALLTKNPNTPLFYAELFLQYKAFGLDKKADAIVKKGMKLFPDFLYLRFYVAHAAIIDGELEKGFELLNKSYNIDGAFPERTLFAEGEFMFFYAALCQYFTAKGNLNNAIICADVLIIGIYKYACNKHAIIELLTQIKVKLEKI